MCQLADRVIGEPLCVSVETGSIGEGLVTGAKQTGQVGVKIEPELGRRAKPRTTSFASSSGPRVARTAASRRPCSSSQRSKARRATSSARPESPRATSFCGSPPVLYLRPREARAHRRDRIAPHALTTADLDESLSDVLAKARRPEPLTQSARVEIKAVRVSP